MIEPAHSDTTQNSNVVIFDSGRFSLWFRIPVLAFGIGCLWLGVCMAASSLLGINLGLPAAAMRKPVPMPALLFSLTICILNSAGCIYAWFVQKGIMYGAAKGELIIWTRELRRVYERRVSIRDCSEFHIRHYRVFLTGGWELLGKFTDGHTEVLANMPPDHALAKQLSELTKLPVKIHERGR